MKKQRKITVELIESGKVHNHRLVEFFARKFNEKEIIKS